jgi:hypothetical protein
MRRTDRKSFIEALAAVYALYRVDLSPAVTEIWWRALQPYEIEQVQEALGRHSVNPDTGQFVPKPADVVKILEGTTSDSAILAWAKVTEAVRRFGSWDSVQFDDFIIHKVISDLGGWPELCATGAKEWDFKAKAFQAAYRAYRNRPSAEFPKHLPGRIEIQNNASGYPGANVAIRFIGERSKLQSQVLIGEPA